MKTCIGCKIQKPFAEFNNWKKAKDGKQPRCRECQRSVERERYQNSETRKVNVRNWDKKRKEEIRAYILEIKKASSCVDCGNNDHRVLDFDHLRDKKHNIAEMHRTGISFKKLLDELAKCEIVCSNCHRIRTHERRIKIGTLDGS